MTDLLRATHPGVRAVLDAPLQMQRETERLRAAAGRVGDTDLEALLAAAAAAWPDGQGPVQTLRFESGQLTLAAPGWAEAQQAQFRERLRGAGYAAEFAEGRLTVTRPRDMSARAARSAHAEAHGAEGRPVSDDTRPQAARRAGPGAAARVRWQSLAVRERRLALAGAAVLGLYLVWAVAVQPAWRTHRPCGRRAETRSKRSGRPCSAWPTKRSSCARRRR